MRIAFYAPLKSPNHAVPSGDRQMARLLLRALEKAGHRVELASELRSFCATPDAGHYAGKYVEAAAEVARLEAQWTGDAPDLWFTYHPYYKAPDMIGPKIAQALDIPYVTAEASYSARRGQGVWGETQAAVQDAVRNAAVNICFTARDRVGLTEGVPSAKLAVVPPFIDATAFNREIAPGFARLVTVAMMRPGDKYESYRLLAQSLRLLGEAHWHLTIVGDGPARDDVQALFAGFPAHRIQWLGELRGDLIPMILSHADLYVWPGEGEAYGLAYLEAQAAGLPVVAQDTAGVPEVVQHGVTGLLTPAGDAAAFAEAIARFLGDPAGRRDMGSAARDFVHKERSLDAAAQQLNAILKSLAVWP